MDEINAKGGLLGRPLEVIYFDTQDFAPERLMLAADALVEQEGEEFLEKHSNEDGQEE